MNDHREPSPYDSAIEEVRSKRDLLDQTLKVLESLREGTFTAGFVALSATSMATSMASVEAPDVARFRGEVSVEPIPHGTFHGMNIQDAVKKLLQMRKRAMGAQEIAADLHLGGLRLQSETPANTITSVLHRAFSRGGEIVRIGRGQWGLQEWYPTQRFNRKATED
jgi:HB1, ASXL, restriction endonuclease HTH domain